MNEGTLNAIKEAILLEKRGQVLYRSVAEKTGSAAVREVFTKMAEEEKKHEETLKLHYSSLVSSGKLAAISKLGQVDDHTGEILRDKVRKEIKAAGYEAAAIAAAIALEKEAERFYLEKRDAAESDIEKDLFDWLATWEHGHMELLASMDKALMEDIWFENSFWPEI
ncbi:MAG TPA: ferritin family protein [Candidatus Sabulitectum sp.]|nr:ferritin family protein [Candidatus Sabulitectum sp.]